MPMRRFASLCLCLIFACSHVAWSGGVSLDGERPLVSHAGGAVELRAPRSWYVNESPYGREIRLLLTPNPINIRNQSLTDGMWLVVHASDRTNTLSLDQMKLSLAERISAMNGQAKPVGEPRMLKIGGQRAIQQEFSISQRPGEITNAFRGFHCFVAASFGAIEIHAIAPSSSFERRQRTFQQILADLRLQQPTRRFDQLTSSAQDARSILGSWKSYRSRIRLSDTGRIAIITDASSPRRGEFTSVDNSQTVKPLTGTFEARGDLLFVTWDDGSRLNFRWRSSGPTLLLTDHDGQISQLRRIFE